MPSAFDQLDRQLVRHEDAAAKRLRRLLEDARKDIRIRMISVGDGERATLQQLMASVDDALMRMNAQAVGTLQADIHAAIGIGAQMADSTLLAVSRLFSLDPQFLQAIDVFDASLVTDVTTEMRGAIARQVQLGVLAGQTTPEIAKAIGATGLRPTGPFKTAEARATVIARTEINRVNNIAIQKRYEQAAIEIPGLKKMWLAKLDGKTRASHREANGQTVGVDEPFTVGGERGMFPLSPEFSGKNTINCRCRTIAILQEEA